MSGPNPLLVHALGFLRRHMPIFPCAPGTKFPATRHGFKDATLEEQQVMAWWAENPRYNVGLPTGLRSRLGVVDLDVKNGVDGSDTWARLLAEHGLEALQTISIETPSGGHHIYFLVPDGVETRCRTGIWPGIDFRGDGGYVVAPPSIVGDAAYQFEDFEITEIAELPAFVLAEVGRVEPQTNGGYTSGELPERLIEALQYVAPDCDYEVWTKVLMGIHDETHGSLDGLAAAIEWSARAPGLYPGAEKMTKKWASFTAGKGVSAGTLFYLAREAGWGGESTGVPGGESEAPPLELRTKWIKSKEGMVDTGKILPDTDNLVLIFSSGKEFSGLFGYNQFRNEFVLTREPPWPVPPETHRVVDDVCITRLVAHLLSHWPMNSEPPRERIFQSVEAAARMVPMHPVREYLEALTWDGTPRLGEWLSDFAGVERTEYAMEVGRMFLIGAVARIYEPGIKHDCMPILIGRQGLGKSSLLRALFGADWFSDTLIDVGNKDAYLALRGKWCVEFAELAAFSKRDWNQLKSFFSSAIDSYRVPYGRSTESIPRQCVFSGTGNDRSCLQDVTGARRFWPLTVSQQVDIKQVMTARDQLWAEATAKYRAGESWWIDENTELGGESREVQSEYQAVDPWEDIIAEKLADPASRMSDITERGGYMILTPATVYQWLEVAKERRNRGIAARVTGILEHRLGWRQEKKKRKIDGNSTRVYVMDSKKFNEINVVANG